MLPARLGIQQRVLPIYRAAFFSALAAACPKGLEVFAGQPRPEESILQANTIPGAGLFPARNRYLFNSRLFLCWQSGLEAWLEKWQPEVLILEANPRYLRTALAVRWMHARRRPVIGWGLGAPGKGGRFSGLRAAGWRKFLSQFDALITYSSRGAEEYAAAGFPAGQVFIAPNAVAPRPTHPAPQRPDGYADGRPVILFVGRLQARKRIDFLLHACAAHPGGLEPHLWIVGDGPERAALEKLAGEVYPSAHFWGARQGSELANLFSGADLFVLPGTGGLAVQEAMSYALPVMVAEADGTQANLVRPDNGWMLPPGDQQALNDCLAQALSDLPCLRAMGQVSYQIVDQEINLEHMVAVFENAVRTVWKE